MHNTKLLFIATATTFLFFTGCSTKQAAPNPLEIKTQKCKIYRETAPSWICKTPTIKDYYVAVGYANKSAWGFGFMRNNAILDANTQIARQIKVQIKNYITSYLSEIGLKNVGDRAIEQFTKQIIYTTTLKNSKLKELWFSNKGNMYVLVTVPKKENLIQIKQQITSSFNNKAALWQKFQSEQAEKKLEEEIKKGGE